MTIIEVLRDMAGNYRVVVAIDENKSIFLKFPAFPTEADILTTAEAQIAAAAEVPILP